MTLDTPLSAEHAHDGVRLHRVFFLIGAGWTAAIGISFGWELYHHRTAALDLAREGAATAYAKDALYRQWNSQHGGVYVPVTETTPPNPYLAAVPERDITTASGRRLTLLNHAYMIRQVYEMDENGPEGHLVAVRPLNPKNAPDPWESRALESFTFSKDETYAVMEMHGQRRFRLIRPLTLEPACVHCHSAQGYKQGDIYGGMSIAVSMARYEADARAGIISTLIVHSGLWLLGLGGILLAWHPLAEGLVERQKATAALSTALAAKQVLLQEVHHRVKNNLQTISSLLNLQAESLPDAARGALEDSQRRVRSMALVHEQLYGQENPGEMDFSEYARSLTSDLFSAYKVESQRVRLELELEPVRLGVNQAIPCGLILNELVINCLKHAFPGSRDGEVVVGLHCPDHNQVTLRVADNGVGLPRGFDWRGSHSLGLRIVDILTHQLKGTLEYESAAGTKVTVNFAKR